MAKKKKKEFEGVSCARVNFEIDTLFFSDKLLVEDDDLVRLDVEIHKLESRVREKVIELFQEEFHSTDIDDTIVNLNSYQMMSPSEVEELLGIEIYEV